MTFDNYYKVGGSLKHNHPTYVFRRADGQIFETLKAREYCFVFNSRQMGKSSLRVQAMSKLKESGVKCTSIDLTLLGSNVSQLQWYKGITYQLLSSFELEDEINFEAWYEQLRSQTEVQRLDFFIESVILKKFCQDIVIFIDEIDSLLQFSFKDDFFAFIRACYNKRAENVEYDRLTFCLLGVTTPADLIADKQRTPFNISRSIELTGLTFEEAKDALIPGLPVENPESVLQQVLMWTGGQPFLTQKLCSLIVQTTQNEHPNVGDVVRQYIIQDWEAFDEPEHLRTIRDRLLSNEHTAIRLLGLYQQILNAARSSSVKKHSKTAIDSSDEQTLRLSGLVVKKDGCLEVYNPIYQAVFHQGWVEGQLDKLRPYSEAINGWLNNHRADGWLLRGKALNEAQTWAIGKSLSNYDYQFFDASQKLNLEQEKTEKAAQIKANQILAEANQKAREIIKTGGAIAFIVVVVSIIYAQQQLNTAKEAREGTRLTQVGDNALRQFESRQLDALLLSMQAGQDLQKLVKKERSIAKYQTIVPLSALLNILANLRQYNQLESQPEKLNSVSFSPDGKIIVAGSEDGTIKRWKRDGTALTPLSGHKDAVTSVSVSPDSKMMASGSSDKTVKLWKPDGTPITFFGHKGAVTSVSFSPDGRIIASGSNDKTVRLWHWQLDGKIHAPLLQHDDSVTRLSFSPDGQIIAVGTDKGTVKLWQPDGKMIVTRQAHQDVVTSISFSPKGEIFASASEDRTVKLWRRDGTAITTVHLQSAVTSISFSPDGEMISIGSVDQPVKLWNWKQAKTQPVNLTGSIERVNSVSFSPDGKTIATANDTDTGTVKLWHWQPGINPLTSLTGHTGKIFNSVGFSQDGKIIATVTDDGNVKVWRRDGTLINKFFGKTSFAASFGFSPDGEIIALGTDEETVNLWKPDGTLIATIPGEASLVWSVNFSPDGQIIAVGTDEGTVKLWKRDGKTLIATLSMEQNLGWATSISFSPDGETIAVGSGQGTIKLWRRDGTIIRSFVAHKKQVNSISFSADGQIIASGSDDRTVKLWKLDGTPLTAFLMEHSGGVTSVSFSPDSQILASGSNDKTVKLWKLDGTAIAISTLNGHSDLVTSVKFSPDGEILASASTDGTVVLWSLNLDDLLGRGCSWLKEYFVTHPEMRHKLTVCDRK